MEVETTIEIDTDELYREIEDSVVECAERAAQDLVENWDFSAYIDYNDGAMSLLRDYSPDSSCALAELFTDKVQAAVGHGDFLAEAVKAVVTAMSLSYTFSEAHLRNVVREEVRDAFAAARHALMAATTVV